MADWETTMYTRGEIRATRKPMSRHSKREPSESGGARTRSWAAKVSQGVSARVRERKDPSEREHR